MHCRAVCVLLTIAFGVSILSQAQLNNYDSSISGNDPFRGQPSISGTVVGTDGVPLHDIRIELRSESTQNLLNTCFSGANRNFEAFNLRPGVYEVLAIDGTNEAREQVTFRGGTTNVSLRLPRPAAPKKGTVSIAELKTPEKARHLTEKARTELGKKHMQDAQKDIDSALAIAPDYADALTLRAVLKLDASQPQLAMEDLDHAVKADPSYGPEYLVLGALFNQLGRFDEALRSLDRSSIYDPNSWQCAFEMSKSWLGKHNYEHALQQANRAQTLSGKQIQGPIHLLRGYALMGENQLAQASSEFEAYLAAEPNGQLAGTIRMTLAKMKTVVAQRPSSVPLPAMSGLFASSK